MALLVDNDIVEKLAQLDLHQEAKALLTSKFGQIVILDTLKFKLCPKNPSKRKKRNATVMARIEDFISEVVIEISSTIDDPDLINALSNNSEGLDAGEMQLLQALLKNDGKLMFTGDKRFLKALANIETLKDKLAKVNGSFICFEQLPYFLITELGFEQVKEKFIQALNSEIKVDTTLKFCFEGREQAIKERVIENLATHIRYVHNDSDRLLSTYGEWQPML